MTADEFGTPKSKYFITLDVPEGLHLDEHNSSKKPLSVDELRRIFRQETVLFPNGMDLADLHYLKMKHDLNPRSQYTYDAGSLRPGHHDHLIVIRLGDLLQIWDYAGFKSPAQEYDPCVMLQLSPSILTAPISSPRAVFFFIFRLHEYQLN